MDLDQLASYAGATETPPYQRLVKDSTRHNQLQRNNHLANLCRKMK
jgi:hypothetical protein